MIAVIIKHILTPYSLWHSKSEKNEMFAKKLKDNVLATDENTEILPE